MNKDELYHSLQLEFNKINKADELQQPLIINNNKEHNLFFIYYIIVYIYVYYKLCTQTKNI